MSDKLHQWSSFDPDNPAWKISALSLAELKQAIAAGWDVNTPNTEGQTVLEYLFTDTTRKSFTKATADSCRALISAGAALRCDRLLSVFYGWDGWKNASKRLGLFADHTLVWKAPPMLGAPPTTPYDFLARAMQSLDWKAKDTADTLDIILSIEGIDANARNEDDETVLHGLADRVISGLGDEGAAAFEGIKYLLARGANPHYTDNEGRTPLEVIAGASKFRRKSRPTIAETETRLRNAVAKVEPPPARDWDWSAAFWTDVTADTLASMLQDGYDPRRAAPSEGPRRDVLWHICVYSRDRGVAQWAVDAGLVAAGKHDNEDEDENTQNEDGNPARISADAGNAELLDFWLDHNPSLANAGYLARDCRLALPAADADREDLLRSRQPYPFDPALADTWLRHGTDVNQRVFTCGPSALSPLAAFVYLTDNADLVHYLLEHGGDPLQEDYDGRNVIELAEARGPLWRENGVLDALTAAADKADPRWILRHGDSKTVRALLDQHGDTLLEHPAFHYHEYFMGRDVFDNPPSPMTMAAGANPNVDVFELLIERGLVGLIYDWDLEEIVSAPDWQLRAIKHAASHNPNVDVVRHLWSILPDDHKADLNLLWEAAVNQAPSIVKFCLELGMKANVGTPAKPQQAERADSPAFRALLWNPNPLVLNILLEAGGVARRGDAQSMLDYVDDDKPEFGAVIARIKDIAAG